MEILEGTSPIFCLHFLPSLAVTLHFPSLEDKEVCMGSLKLANEAFFHIVHNAFEVVDFESPHFKVLEHFTVIYFVQVT